MFRGGLFPRIFLSFWLAMTLIVAAFVAIHELTSSEEQLERRLGPLIEAVTLRGDSIAEHLDRGDTAAAQAERDGFLERADTELYVFRNGTLVLPEGNAEPALALLARKASEHHRTRRRVDSGRTVLAVPLRTRVNYVVVGVGSFSPHWPLRDRALGWQIMAVFLISGFVSYALARYLTRPLRKLRAATQRIAQGDLDVRVAPELGGGEEMKNLACDFDRMAEQVATLLESQARLLRDVSHELRSPLARLNVALELARQRAGEGARAHLDRIERESERLNELIGDILTLSRLENQADSLPRAAVDLRTLLRAIVDNASFEAKGDNKRVVFEAEGALSVVGHHESLLRAFENVTRNAVQFTAAETAVVVSASRVEYGDGARALIVVRDEGSGVSEEAIEEIFRPFYRVGTDRARTRGGTGIGLAIARSAIEAHGGTLRARNRESGGLELIAEIPLDPPANTPGPFPA